jgi:hypothetical protein
LRVPDVKEEEAVVVAFSSPFTFPTGNKDVVERRGRAVWTWRSSYLAFRSLSLCRGIGKPRHRRTQDSRTIEDEHASKSPLAGQARCARLAIAPGFTAHHPCPNKFLLSSRLALQACPIHASGRHWTRGWNPPFRRPGRSHPLDLWDLRCKPYASRSSQPSTSVDRDRRPSPLETLRNRAYRVTGLPRYVRHMDRGRAYEKEREKKKR